MSIFKILFLVGVFAYAHVGKNTVTLNPLAAEHLAMLKTMPTTLCFRVNPESVEGGVNADRLITATYLGNGRAVIHTNYRGATLKEKLIHGLSGLTPEQESKRFSFTSLGVKDQNPNNLGIFIQDGISANSFTPATLAFDEKTDQDIEVKLMSKTSNIVAASFDLVNKENPEEGIIYIHTTLTNIQKEVGENKYTATADGPVKKSAPVYFFEEYFIHTNLKLAGVVTDIIPTSGTVRKIKFVAGVEFNNLVKMAKSN